MKYALWIVAGGLIGFITPSMIGKEWWKFWCGMLAIILVSTAEHLA